MRDGSWIMIRNGRKSPRWPAAAVMVAMLPVLYVLSLGPFVWLIDHGYVDMYPMSDDYTVDTGGFIGALHSYIEPSNWMAENFPPALVAPTQWYILLFKPQGHSYKPNLPTKE